MPLLNGAHANPLNPQIVSKRQIVKQNEAKRLAEFERYQQLEHEQLAALNRLQHDNTMRELERQRELEKERSDARLAKFKLEMQREKSRYVVRPGGGREGASAVARGKSGLHPLPLPPSLPLHPKASPRGSSGPSVGIPPPP